jgi:lon-related putative ATP-dependent protease
MRELGPEEMWRVCESSILGFETTEELKEVRGTIGQDRALQSLLFGLGMDRENYNIFAIGESGTGKMTTIMTLLNERAAREKTPSDWCYVFNFKNPDAPSAISFEAGKGREFQKDMEEFVRYLKTELPKAFESKEYEAQKQRIIDEFQQKQAEYLSKLEEDAKTKGFGMKRGPMGIMIVPIKPTGEMLTKEEFDALDERERRRLEETGRMFQDRLNDIVRVLRDAERLVREMLGRLDRMIALEILNPVIEGLKEKYKTNEKVAHFLEEVKNDVLEHLDEIKVQEAEVPPLPFLKVSRAEALFAKYMVNLIVDNSNTKGAPIVFESNPTYLNLFGRLEYRFLYGMAVTDFSMIKPGSLHRANGGYLIVKALDLLKNPFSYDALKRALKMKELRIEDVLEQFRFMSTSTLKPEPIPLDAKVVLVADPFLYYLLYNLDEEARELFKVKAEFDTRMERTEENVKKYALFVATYQKERGLLPVEKNGVAKLVEYGSRFAEHQDKLTTRLSLIAELLEEADFWARQEGASLVADRHVVRAYREKVNRVNRIEERLREMMLEDTLIVDTKGERVGQVNGLAVLDLGDYSFGKPARITAKTYVGKAGIVNIERETKMSGRIHEKAIFIITSYLGSKYAIKRPLSLSASITFEQLYELVEGDSATCAELYALLSSIANIPLKQSIAVTGSMDQNGEVQPVGGINEKIEGFFELCKRRGLDGTHGVIIPRRNVKNLMLKEEVVEAVKKGLFHIYAIDNMEEGLEILSGMKAGSLREDGTYEEGTFNFLVMKRLEEIAEAVEKKKEEEEKKEKRSE